MSVRPPRRCKLCGRSPMDDRGGVYVCGHCDQACLDGPGCKTCAELRLRGPS